MITGYKKKRLGHPSEKLSGDVPRASWRAVFFSEIVWPIVMAVIFTIAYMFVKSFPDRNGDQPPSPLIRIAVISIGPIVWNAGVLVAQFLISLFLGPMLDPTFPKFGSTMAFIAHTLGLLGMIGFFEFLVRLGPWFLSGQHTLISLLPLVVLGTLGYLTRRPRPRCRHFHTACHPQDLDLRSIDPRIQARRNQQGLVDRKVVRKEPRRARHVSTGSRIFCQDYRTLAVELGLLDRTRSTVYVGTTHLDSLRRQDAFDVAL